MSMSWATACQVSLAALESLRPFADFFVAVAMIWLLHLKPHLKHQ